MAEGEKKNIFATMKGAENNWFLSPQQSVALSSSFSSNPQPPARTNRINDLDSKILEEKAYLKVEDEPLKLEYKIEEKEKALKEINDKIKFAESVDNQQELFTLRVKKQRLDLELRDLYKEYSHQDLPSRISGGVNSVRQRKMPVINAVKRFIKRQVLARVSRKFNSLMTLSDSLEKLDNINRNVDELLKMKTPYGETAENYRKLTEYLAKANKIRSQITSSIKK